MRKSTPPFTKTTAQTETSLAVSDLPRLLDSWLLTCDIEQNSERTIGNRRCRVGKLIWFLENRQHEICGLAELRAFFHYLNHAHKEPGGRWGNPRETSPISSGTAKSYHASIRTFFNWLVEEGEISASPMERISPPVDRPDQIQPFSDDQLRALLVAARRSRTNGKRDEAMLLLMLDTGIRATELCDLKCADADLTAGQVTILSGKGGKARYIPFSKETKRVLYHYLNGREYEPDEPLFASRRGLSAGARLTRIGLLRLINRIAKRAKITGVRCSPHTFRHSFAISFLRAGGNIFTLKQMLGHTSLAMTNRYVAIAQADIQTQHRQFSPVTRLKGGRK